MHSLTEPEQLRKGPYEISDYPDKISDTTVVFGHSKLVPDIIDGIKDSATLKVDYGGVHLENGMVLSPDVLLDSPLVDIVDGSGGTYTLMMVDADAPSPRSPSYRSWLHWLVINIPSNDPVRGEVVCEYMAPEPAGNDRHRFAFLAFKQTGRVTAKAPNKRQGFQVKEFAKHHNLGGEPSAGLFFWSSADAEH